MAHIGETQICQDKGNTEGRQLVVETQFAKVARTIPLTPLQRAIVIGSLLGDATLLPTTAGFCFPVHHGHRQKPYVGWKYAMLSRYVQTAPRECRNGYYFRTVTRPEFSRLREQFYQGARKIVPMTLLVEQFTEHSLAVWLMDDGGADGNQIRLNTQSFSILEVEALQAFLRAKLGLMTSINMDKGNPRLRFTAASAIAQRHREAAYHSEHAIQVCPCNDFPPARGEWTCGANWRKSIAFIRRHSLERDEGIV